MMYTETGNPNSNVGGGYVRAAIRDMTAANKTLYINLFNGLNANGDKSNGGKAGLAMAEAWRYYDGIAPYAGNNKVKTDYTNNTLRQRARRRRSMRCRRTRSTPSTARPTTARSPMATAAATTSSTSATARRRTTTRTSPPERRSLSQAASGEDISGATNAIPISPSGSQVNLADEWARFMRRSSLGIITYTVDVDKIATGQGPGWSALLKSMAGVSNGRYFDVTSGNGGADLADALGRIFSEIQAVNSVFASVSLPVSITTQGTFLNQVYIGQFRPDADALPRWPGNLKQYKLGIVNNQLRTLDADEFSAINPGTGFLTECARSFWTPTTTDTYWAFRPQGDCIAVDEFRRVQLPGRQYRREGRHRPTGCAARRPAPMKTCSPAFASCTTLTDFNIANSRDHDRRCSGAATDAERDALINWMRGLDVDDENVNAALRPRCARRCTVTCCIRARSRSTSDRWPRPNVVVFYGGNDGVLRAVNGNRANAHRRLRRRRRDVVICRAGVLRQDQATARQPDADRVHGIAGAAARPASPRITASTGRSCLIEDASNRWIFASMRRGGRFLYAFDVGAMVSAPGTATLKWKVGCPNLVDDTDCSSGFEDLGQTWSAPQVVKTNGYTASGSPLPMLMFGGGYDACEDARSAYLHRVRERPRRVRPRCE